MFHNLVFVGPSVTESLFDGDGFVYIDYIAIISGEFAILPRSGEPCLCPEEIRLFFRQSDSAFGIL